MNHVRSSLLVLLRLLAAGARRGLPLIIGGVLAFAICSAEAATVTAPASAFSNFMDNLTGAGNHTISFAGNGTPVITSGTAGATALGNMNISHSGGSGLPYATGNIKVPAPSGTGFATAAVNSARFANVGRALFRFGTTLLQPLAVGIAIYDLVKAIGWDMDNPTASTNHAILKPVLNHSCALTSSEQAGYDSWLAAHTPARAAQTSYGSGTCLYQGVWFNAACPCNVTDLYITKSDTVTTTWTQASEDEFASKIDSTTSWPNDAIDRSIADAVKAGQAIGVPDTAPTVTCTQQTIPGSTTTKTNSDGSTYQEQMYWVATCSGALIGFVQKSNITNTSSTGTVTTATTTLDQPDPSKVAECQSGDTTIKCAQFGDPSSSDTVKHDTKNISITPASFSGGSCPSPVAFTAFGRPYSFDYAPLCSRLASLAPLFLALSALLAAYIFADGFRVS